MLNTDNKVNYEINVEKKERKYSWSTFFAWLYLKTIGLILPNKWNRWAENVLYYNKATGDNEIHTDDLKTADKNPEVAEQKSQSEVMSEDEKVQATFEDMATQTDCVETTDENNNQAQQIADLQLKNGLLEVKNRELRSIIESLKNITRNLQKLQINERRHNLK